MVPSFGRVIIAFGDQTLSIIWTRESLAQGRSRKTVSDSSGPTPGIARTVRLFELPYPSLQVLCIPLQP